MCKGKAKKNQPVKEVNINMLIDYVTKRWPRDRIKWWEKKKGGGGGGSLQPTQ